MTDRVLLQDRFVAFYTSTNSIVVDGDAAAGRLRFRAGCTTGGTDYTAAPAGCAEFAVDASGFGSISTAVIEAKTARLALYMRAPQFNSLSDARLKENVEPLDGAVALSTIAALRPVTYTWVDGRPTLARGEPEVGFLAQEVRDAGLGDLVTLSPEGVYGVTYARLAPVLVAGLQDLTAVVRGTAADVATLRAGLAFNSAQLEAATARVLALGGGRGPWL